MIFHIFCNFYVSVIGTEPERTGNGTGTFKLFGTFTNTETIITSKKVKKQYGIGTF